MMSDSHTLADYETDDRPPRWDREWSNVKREREARERMGESE